MKKGFAIKKELGKWIVYLGEWRISFTNLTDAIQYAYLKTFNK